MVISVPVSDPWGSNQSKTFTSKMIHPKYPNQPQTITHGVLPISSKHRLLDGSAALIDGWREPTIFRGYVVKNILDGEFGYQCISSRKTRLHTGSNYPMSTVDHFCGTSGAARYPINKGMDDLARNQALAKANRSEFQVGVFVSELAESVFLLRNLFRELATYMKKALDFLRKGLAQKIRADSRRKLSRKASTRLVEAQVQRVVRTPADKSGRAKLEKILGRALLRRWLEFQYGWKPLLNDIYGLAGLIEEQLNQSMTVKAIANPSVSVAPSTPFTPPINGFCNYNANIITGAKCRVDFVISNAIASTFNRMGLLNIAEIGWELIPFSFVIDWLLPVGSYLGAMSGGWGLTFKGGSITRWTTAEVDVEWSQYQFISGTPIRYKIKSVAFFRYPISDLTPSPIRVKNPINSVSRALTSLALVTQILSKKG